MLNIVVPMAGAGSRFTAEGYSDPKPLIPVYGIPMIELVIRNLTPLSPHRFIFICQENHIANYGLQQKLAVWAPGCKVISIDRITQGAACTVLLARELINSGCPLMIANCDQYIDADINEYLKKIQNTELDGLVMSMTASDPKWSFVDYDQDGLVTRVVEKEVISDEATVGIYNFAAGQDFVTAAETMISREERVNGEFYVAPVYNSLIKDGHKIGLFNIGNDVEGMHGLGTPTDLDRFLSLSKLDNFKELI